MGKRSLLISVVITALWCASVSFAALSADECKELGFSAPSCRGCKVLARQVANEKLVAEWEQCCVTTDDAEEDAADGALYERALLEYDPYFAGESTPLHDFIAKHAADFPNLELKLRGRMMPRFTMIAADGDKEHVPLTNWRTDMMTDYLKGKLKAEPVGTKKDGNGKKKGAGTKKQKK